MTAFNFTKESVAQAMRAVYDWQAANQTRSVQRRSGKIRFIKDTDWERGVFWSCVANAWTLTKDPEYLKGLTNYTLHTGFRPGPLPRFADDHVCIQAYMDVYPEFAVGDILDYSRKALDLMVENPQPGQVDWYWCDSLFMAPPSFHALSKVTGDDKYTQYAETAFWEALDHLWDPETDLVYRDARYIPNDEGSELREANGEKVFWSRGIGWVLAAVPRILRYVPQDYAATEKYLEMFKKLAAQVVKYQHEDGFWRTSLLDPASFPAPESSATALFVYGLAWGIAQGHLDRDTYLPYVVKGWQALLGSIHPNGMIGWVQLPAFNPRAVAFEDNIDYGAGAFLLAGCAVYELAQ